MNSLEQEVQIINNSKNSSYLKLNQSNEEAVHLYQCFAVVEILRNQATRKTTNLFWNQWWSFQSNWLSAVRLTHESCKFLPLILPFPQPMRMGNQRKTRPKIKINPLLKAQIIFEEGRVGRERLEKLHPNPLFHSSTYRALLVMKLR